MQSYTDKMAKNSFWATLSFIVVSICNFIITVIITRYFGKEVYGQYSYFLWLSGILGIVAGFGFQQTLNKFLPKYFFSEKTSEKDQTRSIFRKLLTIQICGSIIISALCIVGVNFFENLIKFNPDQKDILLIITFLSIIPLSLSTFLNNGFAAIQEFQKLSRISIITAVINLVFVMVFALTQQSLINFLWLYTGINTISSCLYFKKSADLLKKPDPKTSHQKEKLFSYSLYSYVTILCTQIVWERSEILFLGMFSDSNQIALYTLSYSLAVLFISVWGPLNSVMNATIAEVIATEKHEKVMMITQHGTKYLAMFMLPLALLASLFIGDIVTFIYGKSFQEVSLLFPALVFSHIIAIIITPAGSIPMLKHEIKKTMVFNISTAALNIILDFYLIVKYQAFGAMLANAVSQFFSIGLALMNAKKYDLKIFNKYMVRTFILNIGLLVLFFFIFSLNIWFKIIVAIVSIIVYIFIILKIGFNKNDVAILKNLGAVIPKKLTPVFSWLIQKIDARG